MLCKFFHLISFCAKFHYFFSYALHMKFILCEFQEKFMQGKNSYEHGLDMDANYATNKPLAPCFTIMIKRKKKHKLSHTFCFGKRTHFKMYPRAGYFCRLLFFVYPDQITNVWNMYSL